MSTRQEYPFRAIESRWQKHWEDSGAWKVERDPTRPKYYVLVMFPYPSGRIHMGHVRNYTIGDVLARYKSARGFNVLHPMGWDALGMPAETAAIEHGVHPAEWTRANIDTMRRQLKSLGFSYDWDREVTTCDPEYYRWEQKVFIEAFKRGLVYRRTALVNWCDQHGVLANEQAEGGICWRCGRDVRLKEMPSWYFKITLYADELLEGLKTLEKGWPDYVIKQQVNWIGRSEGTFVNFRIEGSDEPLRIFTTRPDTLYGVTFMCLAPEHPRVTALTTPERRAEVEKFVEKARRVGAARTKEEALSKKGVFTGSYAINPLNGHRVRIYVANFVLMEYGTGAIMAVPAHDQRDFEFAKTYGIPIEVVINPPDRTLVPSEMDSAYVDEGVLVNSGPFSGMNNLEAAKAITDHIAKKGMGGPAVQYRLRDWGISRQRYWGCPIPMIHCPDCGVVPVPENELPVRLPEEVQFDGKGSPLDKLPSFYETVCPNCGGPARRDTDTMDTFVESSWYQFRFATRNREGNMFLPQDVQYWCPVDQYIGGVEHAILHLLYARFYTRLLRDLGYVEIDEPFTRLLTQGMVCMETYFTLEPQGEEGKIVPRYHYPEEVEERDGLLFLKADPAKKVFQGPIEKMSKSRKNVVDPEQIIKKYGADTARLFIMSNSPPEAKLNWSEEGVKGAWRFIERIWNLGHKIAAHKAQEGSPTPGPPQSSVPLDLECRRITHRTIKAATQDIERFSFNTALARVRELGNFLLSNFQVMKTAGPASYAVARESFLVMLKLLNPFIPHVTEELNRILGETTEIAAKPWPEWEEALCIDDVVEIPVTVNGKVRGRISVPRGQNKELTLQAALADEQVTKWTENKKIVKTVIVVDRIVNIVVK